MKLAITSCEASDNSCVPSRSSSICNWKMVSLCHRDAVRIELTSTYALGHDLRYCGKFYQYYSLVTGLSDHLHGCVPPSVLIHCAFIPFLGEHLSCGPWLLRGPNQTPSRSSCLFQEAILANCPLLSPQSPCYFLPCIFQYLLIPS